MVDSLKNINYNIIGVIIPKVVIPKVSFDNIEDKIIKLCLLDNTSKELTSKNISKLQLANNINKDIIILYDFSKGLNYKEINYFQRLFKKMILKEHKKFILVSRDVNFLTKICDHYAIYQNHLIYETDNIFDDNLYKYIDMPSIVKFIKLSSQKGINLKNTTDINELIKDIYRRKNENKNNL